MDKTFELRETNIFPYPQFNIDNGTGVPNGIEKVRSNVMNFGSIRLDFDVNISYKKTEGGELKVTVLNAVPTATYRFELPSDSNEFKEMFSEGDTVSVNAKGGMFYHIGIVRFSDERVMELDLIQPSIGINVFEGLFDQEVLFRNRTGIKSIDIKYNLSPNDKSSYSNGFDGGNMILTADTSATSTLTQMTPATGSVKNWLLEDYAPMAARQPNTNDYEIAPFYVKEPTIQRISLLGIPYIIPYWREDLSNSYEDGVSPSEFIGDKYLKMIIEVKCWKNANRNHEPFTHQFEIVSDTGWYDENGNGGESQTIVSSVSYKNLIQNVETTSFDIANSNEFTIVLNKTSGSFDIGNNLGAYIAKKSTFEEYNQSKMDHANTYLFSAAQVPCDGVNYTLPNVVGKSEIENLKAEISNGGQTLTVTGVYTPKPSSQDRLDIGDPYLLSVSIYDSPNDLSIQLLADDNVYTRFTDEEGLIELVKGRIYDPDTPIPFDIDTDGYSNMEAWNEDGLALQYKLRQQQGMFGEIVDFSYNMISIRDGAMDGRNDLSNPDDYVVIDSYQIPFDKVSTNNDGMPIYEGSIDREYNLDDDDPFKFVRVSTMDNGTQTEVDLSMAFKVNWKYWNPLNNVPDVFFNPSDSFNGRNQRTSNYSQKPIGAASTDTYNTRAAIFIECQNRETPFTTTYVLLIPCIVYDYGEDKWTRIGDFPDFTGEIFTEKLDGIDLGGSLITGEPTKIKIHWINNGRDPYAIPFWFMVRIEPQEQPGNDIWEISNLREPAEGNLLAPLDGMITLNVYPDGANGWWVECQTVPEKLDPNSSYKLSARMGSNEAGVGLGFAFTTGFSTGFDA
jgi:hypothetical protein